MNEKKYIIEVSHVNKSFKNNKVLKDVTLRCESGRIYGLVGHNGSGKTVLFKTICGFLACDEGTVSVNGKVMGKDKDMLKSDNSVCFVFIQSLNFIILCFLVPVDSKNRRLEQWEKERYGKKAKVQIFCMYMLCLILYLDKKQSIAVAIGVANLTVGGCVCAGKMKNILLKHKEQFRRGK